jgi:GT2 family glycosyltransferase
MQKEIKLMVGIPTINRADLLNESLEKYFEDFQKTHIAICDNGKQEIISREKNMMIYKPISNIGVAGSWNAIIDYANKIDCTHVLMLNDDIYLGAKENEIQELILSNPEIDFFVSSSCNWSAFIIPIKTFQDVFHFDENFFPAYYEDNDYHYRMILKNKKVMAASILNSEIFRESMTIKKNPKINKDFEKNKQFYIKKWGGYPGKEIYKTAFNQ